MKKILFMIAFLSCVLAAGPALAINVDLTGINEDITNTSSSVINGVAFSYDNFGEASQTAAIAGGVISGGTDGLLRFAFSSPASVLSFNITVGLLEAYSIGGGDFVEWTTGSPFGFAGPDFNLAEFFFSTGTETFSISNIAYEAGTAAAVPEPATLLLLAFGLLGLGTRRFMDR